MRAGESYPDKHCVYVVTFVADLIPVAQIYHCRPWWLCCRRRHPQRRTGYIIVFVPCGLLNGRYDYSQR